jgi:hypothetical protein
MTPVPCLAVAPCFLPCMCLSARQSARQIQYNHCAPFCFVERHVFVLMSCYTCGLTVLTYIKRPTDAPSPKQVLSLKRRTDARGVVLSWIVELLVYCLSNARMRALASHYANELQKTYD